jgi:hypothetical protein
MRFQTAISEDKIPRPQVDARAAQNTRRAHAREALIHGRRSYRTAEHRRQSLREQFGRLRFVEEGSHHQRPNLMKRTSQKLK